MEKSQKNANGERLFVRFTVNNEAAVAFYTYDFGPGSSRTIGTELPTEALWDGILLIYKKGSMLLYLVVAVLRKLPRSYREDPH